MSFKGMLSLILLSIEGRYALEKGLVISSPYSLIVKFIIAFTEEKTLFRVELDIPCSINQSRNLLASDDEYDLIGLLPNTLTIYSMFLLAVLMKVLSLPSPFSFKYKSNASEIKGLLSSILSFA